MFQLQRALPWLLCFSSFICFVPRNSWTLNCKTWFAEKRLYTILLQRQFHSFIEDRLFHIFINHIHRHICIPSNPTYYLIFGVSLLPLLDLNSLTLDNCPSNFPYLSLKFTSFIWHELSRGSCPTQRTAYTTHTDLSLVSSLRQIPQGQSLLITLGHSTLRWSVPVSLETPRFGPQVNRNKLLGLHLLPFLGN